MAQLMPLPLTVSCSNKSTLVLPFWYWLSQVVPDANLQMPGDLELLIYHFVIYSMQVVVLLLNQLTTRFNSKFANCAVAQWIALDRGFRHPFCIPRLNGSGSIFLSIFYR